jgi:uncharacterized Tic20 family protein
MTQEQQSAPYRGGIGPIPSAGEAAGLTPDEKLWGMLAHLLVFIGYVGVPFATLVGPAIAYFVQKDKSKYVRFHALQSFVFQLILFAVCAVLAVPFYILVFVTGGLAALIIWPLFGLTWLFFVIYVIYMGIKANHGEMIMYVLVGPWVHRKVYTEDWKPI